MDDRMKKSDLPAITEKFEYDATIGGNCCVENEVTTFYHCHERIDEIKALTAATENPSTTKLVFQKLPKHMRRRAMSHNPNRLPRKYRMAHRAQMCKSGAPIKTKRPSRKCRRKAVNLLREYQRRQRKYVWLETHIWHAKRFHMIPKWGHKLAKSSCDKTFRSSYRATVKHCLIQDISYFGNIEVRGRLDVLRSGFERMRGQSLGLGICAKAYVEGQREGTIELFAIDSYPNGALGRFQFIWQPPKMCNEQRRLWLFAHPSIYRKLCDQVCQLFDLDEDANPKAAYKTHSNKETNVELHEMENHLNRFRLTGPLAHSILSTAFKPKIKPVPEENSWFSDYLKDESNKLIHETQSNYWNQLKCAKSSAEIPPGMILALNIEDPRINRPKKRSKATPSIDLSCDIDSINENDVGCTIPKFNSDSVIWELEQRNRIQNDKVPTHEICVQRNKNILVPGERCAFENKLQALPVLLIQRPGSKNSNRLGYGGGYDVIVPPGYGISTWMCLIMWGARPGALREMETIAREAQQDEFLPDTEIAVIDSDLTENELRKKYFRTPPNKRQNYLKLSIASPFKCPWEQLIQEWCTESQSKKSVNNQNSSEISNLATVQRFFVLRNKNKLRDVEQFLAGRMQSMDIDENCLIPISITLNGRGNIGKYSIVCLPNNKDLQTNIRNRKQFPKIPSLTEPIGIDHNETKRKLFRLNHLKMLKRLRRQRVRVKRKKQEYSERKVIIAPPRTANLINLQYSKMCELWLPMSPKSVRHQCKKEVFGYLSQSQFMFHEAKVSGIGYVTSNGIRKLSKLYHGRKSNQVLVRDPTSLIYRWATITIRCDQ